MLSDAELERRVMAAERQVRADDIAKRIGECGIPPDLIEADTLTAESLPGDAQAVWSAARDVVAHYVGRQAIVALIEGYGTGKSTIAAGAVLRELKAGRVARYVTAWDYLARYDAASKRAVKETSGQVQEAYCIAPLLVIDELHEQQPMYGGLNTLAIRRLILRRWDYRLTTVLISNDLRPAFLACVGDAIASRMHQGGATMQFSYGDLRQRVQEIDHAPND